MIFDKIHIEKMKTKGWKKCVCCEELTHPENLGGQIVDYDHWFATGEWNGGEIRMIDSKNPEQCRWCEWGPEA